MIIYTSYFANYRNFPKPSTPISIARFTPRHCAGMQELKVLAPSEGLLFSYKEGHLVTGEYNTRYIKELLGNIDSIRKDFLLLSHNRNYILLCYEKKGRFCHRNLLQVFFDKYLTELGMTFKEL